MTRIVWLILILGCMPRPLEAETVAELLCEEEVYTCENPKNGSGPLWAYGCTSIARDADRVFVSQFETGRDVPPLCNTRWRLLWRDQVGWTPVAEAPGYRQREPCPLAITPGSLWLNVNDSLTPPGTNWEPCKPYLIRFDLGAADLPSASIEPQWSDQPYFTDHSYRGFAADRARGEVLMLNVDNRTTIDQSWCLLSATGETLAGGSIHFPFRGCYGQAALVAGAAYFMATSDFVETVEEWHQFKLDQGMDPSDWDFVHRIIYFTWSPDLRKEGFRPVIEVANVDDTAGAVHNEDLWISPGGRAYVMYTQQDIKTAALRDRFFPGRSTLQSLQLAVVYDGKIVGRHVLLKEVEGRAVSCARFHETADGRVYAVLHVSGQETPQALLPVYPQLRPEMLIPIPLQQPMTRFCLASTRAGNAATDVVDLLGYGADQFALRYAAVRIGEATGRE